MQFDRCLCTGGGDAEVNVVCAPRPTSWKSTIREFKGGQAHHTTMASRTLSLPLRAFAGTRPSIQAWRSTRTFATEVAPASTTLPIPSDLTAPITPPVVQDAQSKIASPKETEGSTSGKSRPVGVVVSAGKMQNTVKVRLPSQKWNNYLRKVICILLASLWLNTSLVSVSENGTLTIYLFPCYSTSRTTQTT